jgi:hypothetical protein
VEAQLRKRTIWIWVIFILLGLYTGISLLGMIQVHSGKLPLTPAQKWIDTPKALFVPTPPPLSPWRPVGELRAARQ